MYDDPETSFEYVMLTLATWGSAVTALLVVYFFARAFFKVAGRGDELAKADDDPAEEERRCADCGYDLQGTPHRCPECGAFPFDRMAYLRSIREDWPDAPIAPRAPLPGEAMVVLVSTDSPAEAEQLSEQLKARGMACIVGEAGVREQRGYDPRTTVYRRVMVYAADLEMAHEYLWRARGIPKELLPEMREREARAAARGDADH